MGGTTAQLPQYRAAINADLLWAALFALTNLDQLHRKTYSTDVIRADARRNPTSCACWFQIPDKGVRTISKHKFMEKIQQGSIKLFITSALQPRNRQ